ncbi:MAG: HAD family hydrolase [Oscillospiraceae bacterium]
MGCLFVSDLDGTLLSSEIKVSDYTINAINDAISKGAIFTVATARSFVSASELTKKLNINAPVILMNGVFVYDIKKDEYIKYEEISKPLASFIIDVMKRHKQSGRMFGFDGKRLLSYTESGCKHTFPEDIENHRRKIVPTQNLADNINSNPIVSFVLIDSFENLGPIYREIKDNETLSCCFYEDIYKPEIFWLEIYSSRVNKANAVSYVKEYCKAQRLVTFGDNLNDIEMLTLADEGIAMANAVSKAKEASNLTLKWTNDEDGVARYISNLYGDEKNG